MSAPALTAAPAAKATAAAAAGFDIVAALKNAGFAALVALGLCIPILSYKTEQNGGLLFLAPRWGLVALICALVFAGRLAYRAYDFQRASRKSAAAATPAIAARHATGTGVLSRIGVPLFLGVALGFPFIVYAVQGGLTESRYWVDLGVLMLTYVMLGWGLNIVVGLAGLLDLGYVAFYAVGAYSYALLSTTFGLSFWICLPIAGMLAAFWGILLGFPVLRLRGDYLAIVTLAFGEIIRLVLINWVDLTNGGAGITSIPRVSFFGLPFTDSDNGFAAFFGLEFNSMHRIVFLYYLILALALITNYVTMRLRKLPVGRAWEALARGRDRLSLPRHQHHQHQAHRLRPRRRLRRLRRLVLRGAAGLRLSGELQLPRIGDHPRHRRARRHGLADRRRHRRGRPRRRPGDAAKSRLPESDLRRGTSIPTSIVFSSSASAWSR